jgi:hypothetical protein
LYYQNYLTEVEFTHKKGLDPTESIIETINSNGF